MRRLEFLLFILFIFLYGNQCSASRSNEILFSFTAPVYNISLEENARGNQFASSDDTVKMGVPLPHSNSVVKFKIVEGDKNHQFKAYSKQVGDFVFLRIRQKDKNDTPLNRELKDLYQLVVKATSKQKNSGNVETTAIVRLRVLDRNDASPMFTLLTDQYEGAVTDDVPPFTEILKVEASDADIGINGEIYYSLVNRSSDFTVDPISGWVRSLRQLQAGTYSFQVRAEDRASRIFNYDEEQKQPSWTSNVQIIVTEKKKVNPKLLIEKRTVLSHKIYVEQIAGFIRVEGGTNHSDVTLVDDDLRHWFHVNKSGDVWTLYTNKGHAIKEGTNVTLSVGNGFSRESNTTATIIIDVARQYNISFSESKLLFEVEEDVPLNYIIGKVYVNTLFVEDQSLVRFEIQSGNDTSLPFHIDKLTGAIRVVQQLDFESKKFYHFNVEAKLFGHVELKPISIQVEANVLDSNDHFPVFAVKWGRQGPIAVPERAKLNSVLLKIDAIDHDSNENGKLAYKLLSGKPIPFDVNHSTGEINLIRSLPKDENVWKATLWAVDGGHPLPRSSSLNLIFYRNGTKVPGKPRPVFGIPSANLLSPSFANLPKTLSIFEDAKLGTVVTKVKAIDGDSGYNGIVQYSSVDEYFMVDRNNGDVTIARNLQSLLSPGSESIEHELSILASDLGIPRKNTTGTIRIVIKDVNNYIPQFDQPWYRTQVQESSVVGKKILIVSATDQDHGEAGRVGYRLVTQNESYVQINEESGEITISKPLDREFQDILRYTVVAFDHGTPQLFSFINLTIVVEDINDNPPVCLEPVTTVSISEDFPDTALIGCLSAVDRDIGINARLRYSIENEGNNLPFFLDPITGCVFVNSKNPLDYRAKSVYNISIEISDNGESILSTTCHFVVNLIEVFENTSGPLFEDVAHEASVYENMPIGTEVFTLQPLMQHSKVNKEYLFSPIDGNGLGYFSVNDGTIRTLVVFDREEQSSYWLTIEVSHATRNIRYAVVHVFVRILDKNDHRPFPNSPIFFASVKENSPQNTVVVKLEASDGDELPGSQSSLAYSIVKGDPQSFFRIDPVTGYITTSGSRKLDRETQSEHELSVSICDNGEPQLCSTVLVVISIEDVNDNPPMFSQAIHHYNVKAGESGALCRIFAYDADSGANGQLYYNITQGDPRFSINEHGYISTNTPLGNDEVFHISVHATDRGLPAQLAQTRVVITGTGNTQPKKRKNKKPAFKNSFPNVTATDSDQVGVTIITLEASDDDSEILWWSIEQGNVEEVFSMRSDTETNTGALILAKPISVLPIGATSITLTLTVSDGDSSISSKITVNINRNTVERPKFSALTYHTEISEKTPVGSTVYNLKVLNARGDSKITYSLYSCEDEFMLNKFRIEPNSGNLVVVEPLDFEVTKKIRMIVAAQRGSSTGFAFLSVDLLDANDNPPRFLQREFVARIPFNAPTGYVVQKLLAHDRDVTQKKSLRYAIISGNEEQLFSLGEISGIVRIAKPLADELRESVLTIRATDGDRLGLTDSALLRVEVDGNTKNSVKFMKSVYQLSIKDDIFIGSPLVSVSTSRCCGKYRLQKPCPHFTIHPITGVISSRKWFSQERAKVLECFILYEHSSGTATSKISARLVNTNKYAPIFRQLVYEGFIIENSPAGTAVVSKDGSPLVITASDKDYGPSGLVTYRTLNQEEFFTVDFATGAVKSRSSIDFEVTKEITFFVQASDMGHPMRTSALPAEINIKVLDANDEKPEFSAKSYDLVLKLPTTSNVILNQITATDKDTTGKLRYFLKDQALTKFFDVEKYTGIIKTGPAVHTIYEKSFTTELVVTDGMFSDSCTLNVQIEAVPTDDSFRCFSNNLSLSLPENRVFATMQSVAYIYVDNAPNDAPLTYTILNHNDLFAINSRTGHIMLAGPPLDREIISSVHILVQVHAHSIPPVYTQCVVDIKVLDENDCVPRFLSQPYDVVTSTNMKIDHSILTVKAVDDDYGDNAVITYSSSNIPTIFKLDKQNGQITVASQLITTDVYQFTVTATDQGTPPQSTTVEVKVTVLDRMVPFFTNKEYHSQISSGMDVKEKITSVKAINNPDGHVVYTIVKGNDEQMFSIDINTGDIILARRINLALSSKYELIVEASDALQPDARSRTKVVLEISMDKESVVEFEKSVYHVNVTESTSPGAQLLQLEILPTNNTVKYSLSGAQASVIRIESTSGLVYLVEPLDYETKKEIVLSVIAITATDTTAEAKLIIHVIDVNDVSPVFVLPEQELEISDAFSPGQLVTIMKVSDEDTVSSLSSGYRYFFSIIDGDESLFSIDETNGEIILTRTLDEEDILHSKKTLNVSVSDGIFTVYAKINIRITLSSQRTPAPRFEQTQYVLQIMENRDISDNLALMKVEAIGGSPPLRFRVEDGDSWPISVEPNSGKIFQKTRVQFLNQSYYNVPLVVEDSIKRKGFSTLALSVIDENDKPPNFVVKKYTCSVSTSAKEGDPILLVSATDEDADDVLEYSILADDDVTPHFNIHSRQGLISIGRRLLDAGSSIMFTVKATDSANPPHHSTAEVVINVVGDDVHVPKLGSSHFIFNVDENCELGTVVGKITQFEPSVKGSRFAISSPVEGLPFLLEKQTGKLIVRGALDREIKREWKFIVSLTAPNSASSLCTVTVQVNDLDDNPPVFQTIEKKFKTFENSIVGTTLTVFSAIDLDDSSGGRVYYSIVNTSQAVVKVDKDSGWLTLAAKLDREQHSLHSFTVRATDESNNFVDLNCQLEVLDVNDEPPVFAKPQYRAKLDLRKLNPGQSIARVHMKDKDDFPFNKSQFFITQGNTDGLFKIDSEGKITMVTMYYPLHKNSYELTVMAFDGLHSATTSVKIDFENIKIPDCDQELLLLNVTENSPMGTVIWQDKSHTTVSHEIKPIDKNNMVFSLRTWNSSTTIITSADIDREKKPKYSFLLRSYMKFPVMECIRRVEVTVLDINDNNPIFSKEEYVVSIKENLPASEKKRQFLIAVQATDEDFGANGMIRYSSVDAPELILVDSLTGVITLTGALDSEQRNSYQFTVIASDSGDPPRSGKANVKINVIDQNDNPPVFEMKEYNVKVLESQALDTFLVSAIANGGDQNESVSYSLESGKHNDYVNLDTKTGKLTLANYLDYEKFHGFQIVVIATDSGNPPLSTKASINIEVMDENDNYPIFSNKKYSADLKENSQTGTLVLKVHATDEDSEHFGKVKYSIVGNKGPFEITPEGNIIVAGDIDYESAKQYELNVDAKDGGGLATTVPVTINVIDLNDNAPHFSSCNMTAVVQEGVLVGHSVYLLNIKDLDGPEFGQPFSIQLVGSGNNTFKVVEYEIVTTAALSHSKRNKYEIKVVARDRGGLTTECQLTIFVKEESRHAPKLIPLKVHLNTLKGEFKGGTIGRLKGTDEDKTDMLRYTLIDGSIIGPSSINPHHEFVVDQETGDIWCASGIVPGLHGFNVSVTDGKFNTLSYVEVEVSMLDSDVLENAVAIRILNISLEDFFKNGLNDFLKVFSHSLNVPPENINILSIQEKGEKRVKKSTAQNVDILFTVQRGYGTVDRGLLKPTHIYSRLKSEFDDLKHASRLQLELITEVCMPGVCDAGECREKIELTDDDPSVFSFQGTAYVTPQHSRIPECSCPEGYGGATCNIRVNQCSNSPCPPEKMCVADATGGYECICPPGAQGDQCEQFDCDEESQCSEDAEISMDGSGYFELLLPTEIEDRMELVVEVRTVSHNGTVLYGSGVKDFHELHIHNGYLEYHWDCGSGVGKVKSDVQVADGKWHRIRISRNGRHTRLVVDGSEKQEGWSVPGSEVLNIQSFSNKIIFGARIDLPLFGSDKSVNGVAACFRTISLDGRSIAKSRNNIRLYGVQPGCQALASTPCSESQCKNGATCVASGKIASCICPERYDGKYCEIDKRPCDDDPCPYSIKCIPYTNDYMCKCPDGYTGKNCDGPRLTAPTEDACRSKPCGDDECVSIPKQSISSQGFLCKCPQGFKPGPCDDTGPKLFLHISMGELIGVSIVFFLIICCVLGIICLCRWISLRRSDPKYGEHVSYNNHMRNPNVCGATEPTTAPPPLPPRVFRGNKLSNLEQAQLTGLPTVQVRPFPIQERIASSQGDSRSPSLIGPKKWGNSSESETLLNSDIRAAQDAQALEALRRMGVNLNDEGGSVKSSAVRHDVHRSAAYKDNHRDGLTHDRYPIGDFIQCLPSYEGSHWDDGVDRIGAAVQQERLRLQGLNGRMHIGDTVLSPLVNDDDYMTMRPRKVTDSTESHKRPLLADQDDKAIYDQADSGPPSPPAHKTVIEDDIRLYDDPMCASTTEALPDKSTNRLNNENILD